MSLTNSYRTQVSGWYPIPLHQILQHIIVDVDQLQELIEVTATSLHNELVQQGLRPINGIIIDSSQNGSLSNTTQNGENERNIIIRKYSLL